MLNVLGNNRLSRLVCPLIGCVHYSDIFGVMNYKIMLTYVLDLLPHLVVCTCINHKRLLVDIYVCVCVILYFALIVGAGGDRLLGSFTLRDGVFMGRLLCVTYTLVHDVSLWGVFCGVVFCLKISVNCLIVCSLEDLMNANEDVGDGL